KLLMSSILVAVVIGTAIWSRSNTGSKRRSAAVFETDSPVRMDVINKRVIAGSLVPHKEVVLRAQITGIVDKLYVAVGDKVSKGKIIARIKATPQSKDIESAKKDLQVAKATSEAATAKHTRSKELFEKKMLSPEQYEEDHKVWRIAHEEVIHAQKQLEFILQGHIAGSQGASNLLRSTINGIVAELPYKEGSVVMEHSVHNEGSNIATIADMNTMLFQGEVGEMDIAYLRKGMTFEVALNAIRGGKFQTTLTKVAPKATASKDRSVKFAIEGTVQISPEDQQVIRAGYTATADVVLEKVSDALAIKEKYLHIEEEDDAAEAAKDATKAFVWIQEGKQKVKKYVNVFFYFLCCLVNLRYPVSTLTFVNCVSIRIIS
ncbi:MAG: efflux RND transporter periplasmic adaptor subunit, partial [Bacteroidota bacterium]